MLLERLPLWLLLLVAGGQLVFAYEQELLVPGKGGGYGLFSTVDRLDNREIRILARDASGQEISLGNELQTSPRYADLVQRVRAFPSGDNARRLMTALLDGTPRDALARVTEVRLEVWKHDFDSSTRVLRRRPVRAHTFPVSLREAQPVSLREAQPASLREAQPASLREAP